MILIGITENACMNNRYYINFNMIAQEESIYNLIPKEEAPKEKPQKYKSKFPPTLPPTYSTFCLKTTSMPGVANVPGEYELPCGAHKKTAMNGTFGLPKGAAKPDAARFTKKGTGTFKLPDSSFLFEIY
jgi:hypothetical protein